MLYERRNPFSFASPRLCERNIFRQLISVFLIVVLFFVTTPQVQASIPVYSPVFYYYQGDHLGSSNILTDQDGDLVQHYEYKAFGNERFKDNTSAFSVSNRYTDQILDEDTGLYYYGSRYYDPELARFVQPDSIVPSVTDPQSLNRYSYVRNNPFKMVDPTGHTSISLNDWGSSSSSSWQWDDDSFNGSYGAGYFDTSSFSSSSSSFSSVSQYQAYQHFAIQDAFQNSRPSYSSIPSLPSTFFTGTYHNLSSPIVSLYGMLSPDNTNPFAEMFPSTGNQDAADASFYANLAGLGYGLTRAGFSLRSSWQAAKGAAEESRMVTVLGSRADVAPYAGKPGFNVLDMSSMPKSEWPRYNAGWLNKAVVRGDDVWLVTNPVVHEQLMLDLGKTSAYIDLELPMLERYSGVNVIPKYTPVSGKP